MELDELRSAWQALDARVNALTAVNLRLITEAQTRRARMHLLPTLAYGLTNIGVGGWLVQVFVNFWMAHRDVPSALASGVALQLWCTGVVITGVLQLLLILRINFARPVVTLQRYLAWLRVVEVRSFYWLWTLSWLLLPAFAVAVAMAVAQVDLWARSPSTVLGYAALGGGVALASWAFLRWAHRPGSTLGPRLERVLLDRSIDRARAALAHIDDFARG